MFNLSLFQASGMLLQLLTIPIIIRNYGLSTFGEIALSGSFAILLSNLVNYGTNQTAVKDVSIHRNDNEKLSYIFSETFLLRLIIFLILITTTTIVTIVFKFDYLLLWFSILPLIASEIFNPLYFLIGIEKIQWISWGNLMARALSLGFIIFINLHLYIPIFLNLMLFVPLLIYFFIIHFYIIKKFKLSFSVKPLLFLRNKIKDNFYVTFNGTSVVLQQSIFMFAIAGIASSQSLGAYGIIDKLSGAVRQLISAFSSAIYPRAAQLFNDEVDLWIAFKKKIQFGYAIFFLVIAVLIFVLADFCSIIFTHKEDPTAILFFKYFSLVPLVIALNANNVLEMLLRNQYRLMFNISLLIVLATSLISFILTRYFQESVIGLYPFIIESICLIIYIYFLRINKKKSLE